MTAWFMGNGGKDMIKDILTIGDKIELRLLDQNEQPMNNYKPFVSQLVDFIDYNTINIVAPIMYGKTILLKSGRKYNLCFYTNRGLYQCNCVAVNNYKDNKTMISEVQIISDLEKFQRRQYYRLECIIDIQCRNVTIEELELEELIKSNKCKSKEEKLEYVEKLKQLDQQWYPASVTDISGGGARFVSTMMYNTGNLIKMKLDIPINGAERTMVLCAKIITSERVMNRNGYYENRVKYIDIGKQEREDLIKYIFEQERLRRKNKK